MAAINFVQNLTSSTAAGTGSFTTSAFSRSTSNGNTLIITVADDSGLTNIITSITDSTGLNTYTQIFSTATSTSLSMWYCPNIRGGSSVTLTINYNSTSASNVSIVAQEFSGVLYLAPLDRSTSAIGTSTTPSSGATAITTKLAELVVGSVAYGSGGGTATIGAGFTNLGIDTSNAFIRSAQESKVISQTAAQTATFTTTSIAWACGVATFYASYPSFRPNTMRPAIFKPGIAR